MERDGHSGQNGTRDRQKGGASAIGVGSGERREKRLPLVGDVQEYWGFYEGEGANTFRVL